jgi:hypothetical protein
MKPERTAEEEVPLHRFPKTIEEDEVIVSDE